MVEKKYQCLIVDDEPLARDLIAAHLSKLPQFEVVCMSTSAIEASQHLKQFEIDLLFLDIEMPVLKGTDFYRSLVNPPRVIFTTAHRDYATDGFDLEAVDYLLKPVTFTRFFKAIERFQAQQESVHRRASDDMSYKEYLFVRADRKEVKVNFSDILYVQGLKDYIQIYTVKETLVVKSSLSSFLDQLNDDFLQVHRSYIINKNRVTAYSSHDVEMGAHEIPIGETFKNQFLSSISK